RIYRIGKRFFKQKLRIEESNYKPTPEIFIKMFKWNRDFEKKGKVNLFNKYGIHKDKMVIINKAKLAEKYVHKLQSKASQSY
ncbi:hypothetical protein R0J90_16430, partial [Micrococcus sp. SIMBA_144]